MAADRTIRERFGIQVLVGWFVLCSILLPLGIFYSIHVNQQSAQQSATENAAGLARHTVSLQKLIKVENQVLALAQELKAGHVDTEHELSGIQTLLNYVSAAEASATKPNPIIVGFQTDLDQVKTDLLAICAREGDPGCTGS